MSGFNEGKTERKLFIALLLCGLGGGWLSDSLARHYKLDDWLGVLLSIFFTGFFLLLVIVLVSKWEERDRRNTMEQSGKNHE